MKFKRHFKGYAHFIGFELLFVYRAYFDENTTVASRIILAIASILVIVLLIRFLTSVYLEIDDHKLIIKRDLFITKEIDIKNVDHIVLHKSSLVFYSKIFLKDGRKITFNESYLSNSAKSYLQSSFELK